MMEIVSVKGTEASIWEKKKYIYIYSCKGEGEITKTIKSLFAQPGRCQLKMNANMSLTGVQA